MIPVDQARESILDHVNVLPAERVWFMNALGRFLAEDIVSTRDIPAFDNSAMDGYAVRCEDVSGANTALRITGVLPAGTRAIPRLEAGHAVKIMTGAPVPPGADAVVRKEDASEQDGVVTIAKAPAKHENIRFAGEDIRKGSLALTAGDHVGPAHVGVLASLGRLHVMVGQRPRVAVVATGDEIVEPGDEGAGAFAVTSSNSYTLASLISSCGGVPVYLGIARDSEASLEDALDRARLCDLIVTTGGVSMGEFDLVRKIMNATPNRLHFWGVEIKPGKPLAFGEINGIPTIGLPGNPASTMTAFYQFVRPALLKMQGARDILLPRVQARLAQRVSSKGDRPHYIRCLLECRDEGLVVTPTGPQGSGILSSLARGNCFVVVPKGTRVLERGALVDCELYDGIRSGSKHEAHAQP